MSCYKCGSDYAIFKEEKTDKSICRACLLKEKKFPKQGTKDKHS